MASAARRHRPIVGSGGARHAVAFRARNWGRNQRWSPAGAATARARSTRSPTLVGEAHRAGRRVKAIGAGHSFTAIAATDGVQLSLDHLDRVLAVDHERGPVTVAAGIRLRRLNEALAAAGLAMPNLGDIDRQSIAGAIATATHGTGLALGNLATTVVGMELVTGDGVGRALLDQRGPGSAARRPRRPRGAWGSSPR